jgi:hypothetical protein
VIVSLALRMPFTSTPLAVVRPSPSTAIAKTRGGVRLRKAQLAEPQLRSCWRLGKTRMGPSWRGSIGFKACAADLQNLFRDPACGPKARAKNPCPKGGKCKYSELGAEVRNGYELPAPPVLIRAQSAAEHSWPHEWEWPTSLGGQHMATLREPDLCTHRIDTLRSIA